LHKYAGHIVADDEKVYQHILAV